MPANSAISPRMIEITERDFWSSLRALRGKGQHTALLRDAIAFGKKGRKAQAYRTLAAYHKASLTGLWRWAHDIRERLYRLDDEAMEKTLDHYAKIDWVAARGRDAHAFGWMWSVIGRLVDGEDPRLHDFLCRKLAEYYSLRHKIQPAAPKSEHPIFGALHAGFKIEALASGYVTLLNRGGGCPPDTTEAVLKLMMGMGRWLEERVKPFKMHNVHAAAVTGLFTIARMFPEFSESVKWNRLATRFMLRTINRSFFSDGCHGERVWGYGFYTVQRMHRTYDFAQACGGFGAHDNAYRQRLRESYRFFAKTLGPDELKPSYGDDELFSGKSIIDEGRPLFPETTDRFYGVDRSRSYLFPESGFAVLRNGDTPTSTYINTTFGKFAGWHSHHDTLSMNLWAYNKPLIEELNRYSDYGNPLDLLFRAPESHNQPLIDGVHYDSRGKRARDVAWHSDEHIDYFSAKHTAYRWLPNVDGCAYVISMNAAVRRTILLVKKRGYALVLDSIRDEESDNFNRAVTAHWHSPFGFKQVDARTAVTKGSPGCVVMLAHKVGIKAMEIGADYAGEDAARDELYWERHHLRIRRWMPRSHPRPHHGCVGFATLLYPFKGRMPRVSVEPIEMPGPGGAVAFRAEAFEVRTPAGRDVIVLNPELLDSVTWQGKPMRERARVRLGAGKWIGVRNT